VILHTRKVFDTAATYEDNGVLLEVVTNPGDI
jgi:hypothetical protein